MQFRAGSHRAKKPKRVVRAVLPPLRPTVNTRLLALTTQMYRTGALEGVPAHNANLQIFGNVTVIVNRATGLRSAEVFGKQVCARGVREC